MHSNSYIIVDDDDKKNTHKTAIATKIKEISNSGQCKKIQPKMTKNENERDKKERKNA